ncbi:MAG TPA: hypothetical protein VGZ02_10725 [Candidatus Baltobacteraceae bacterium]|jgi:hypothetical protein|nr:hypothetical protein [Candidatus Baltobacteraceae bacterium]
MGCKPFAIFLLLAALTTGCEGTQTGKTLFGTPSNNGIASIQISFPTAPSRAAGAGIQYLALTVNAYDRWGNLITVPYNGEINLSSTGSSCEIAFSFYQNENGAGSSPPPLSANLAFNSPQAIGVAFDPACGPNPVTITASANGASNATLTF